jgi:hypothetical protein
VGLGFWLASLKAPTESYDLTVRADEYPLADTNVRVTEDDIVEVRVLEANRTSWDCGHGATTAAGLVRHEYQSSGILPSANVCSLVAQIEGGPPFVIGAYEAFVADVSGSLFLGANDTPPDRCSIADCWADNEGELFVKITVTRR